MICQTAPEERPETHIRFAEGETIDAFKSKSLLVQDPVSATDHFVGQVFSRHRIVHLAAGDGLLSVPPQAGRQHPVHPVNPV